MSKSIYLDYAAATPMHPEVPVAMRPYFSEKFYNPSATYLAGRDIRIKIDEARASIAGWLGSRPSEIYFTAGATEANNLAITGMMKQFPKGEILVSAIEHDSVLAPASLFKSKQIPVTKQGIVDTNALKKMISKNTVLVSVMMINNELGTLQPIREIASIIKEVRKDRLKDGDKNPIYLHTDAAQAGNYLDLHVSRLGVDMMSINGGKIYGPKQSGILFVQAGIVLQPIILGGGQERSIRSGTENVPGIIGLAKALDLAQSGKSKETERVKKLRDLFISELAKKLPQAVINGSTKHQAPHILHITLPGTDNERLMMELDEKGIQAAVGSACNASSTEPSHVLKALGMNDQDARASLRFSFGHSTTKKDIQKTVKVLKNLPSTNR
jgi:cysteine desulfurase